MQCTLVQDLKCGSVLLCKGELCIAELGFQIKSVVRVVSLPILKYPVL